MSAERFIPSRPVRKAGVVPPPGPTPAGAFTLAIYLAALLVPGLGSTLAWAGGCAWTRDPALSVHFRRALAIQIPCLAAMVGIQAAVVGALWLGFPEPGALRSVLVLAGLQATAGVYLAMGLYGPIRLVAERQSSTSRDAPRPERSPARGRTTRVVSTRPVRPG